VPVEEQARRPLSRRDRRFLAAAGCVAVLGVGGVVLAYAGGSHGPSRTNCVSVTVPSTMGGASVRACGAAAARFCRTQGRLSTTTAAECERVGFAVRP
jgi:hypothetical protein